MLFYFNKMACEGDLTHQDSPEVLFGPNRSQGELAVLPVARWGGERLGKSRTGGVLE